ncbi:MAG: hypothetical protein HC821_04830, partial [Lewinella sp.]|nr:hypothetical protein [Lewinella sp.]
MGTTGFDNTFGFGRLNAEAALRRAIFGNVQITGGSHLCSGSPGTYQVSNLNPGITISWSATGPVSINANTGQATATGSGQATIRATLTAGCGTTTLTRNIG